MPQKSEKRAVSKTDARRVPALRFPEFSGEAGVSSGKASRVRDAAVVGLEWEEKKIEEVADVNPGGGIVPENFVYIDLESVEKGVLKSEKTVEKKSAPSRAQRRLKRNDVIFQMVRPYQQNNYLFDKEGDYVASTGYAQLRVQEDAHFLYHYLHATPFVNKVLVRCTGSSYPAINSDDLKKIRIYAPSVKEQEKIAGFLGAVDEWIGTLREEQSALETYKRGIMQRLFSSPPARGGVASLRVEGVGDLRFRDDAGNDFPEWEEKQFGNVFSFRKTNSLSRELLNYESGEVKNIHYGDIHTKFSNTFDIEKEDVPYINSEVGFEVSDEADYLHEGDLVIADASEDYKDVGKSLEISNLDTQKVVAGLHTVVARALVGKVARGFSGYLMKARNVRLQIMRLAVGISVLGISKRNLSEMRIQLPSIDEQQKIADFLTALDEVITTKADEITRAEEWKKGLMQKMFV